MRWMPHTAMCEGKAILSPLLSLKMCYDESVRWIPHANDHKKWHSGDLAMVEGVFDLLVSETCIAGEIILVVLGLNKLKCHFIPTPQKYRWLIFSDQILAVLQPLYLRADICLDIWALRTLCSYISQLNTDISGFSLFPSSWWYLLCFLIYMKV